MVAATTSLFLAVAGTLLGTGVVFEIGRRIGRAKSERENVEEDIEQVEDKLDQKFTQLDQRLEALERVRQKEHDTVITWLTRLTQKLGQEGYDVEEPDAVRRTIDVHSDSASPDSDDD